MKIIDRLNNLLKTPGLNTKLNVLSFIPRSSPQKDKKSAVDVELAGRPPRRRNPGGWPGNNA
ncbi:MAG: hypothetical protein AAFO84_07395 [Cyanobacteria bacterium J06598_1]